MNVNEITPEMYLEAYDKFLRENEFKNDDVHAALIKRRDGVKAFLADRTIDEWLIQHFDVELSAEPEIPLSDDALAAIQQQEDDEHE